MHVKGTNFRGVGVYTPMERFPGYIETYQSYRRYVNYLDY